MIEVIRKYLWKLQRDGLCRPERVVLACLDDDLYTWAGDEVRDQFEVLKGVLEGMNINSLIFCVPEEPYYSLLKELLEYGVCVSEGTEVIVPEDCETRTFFHEIPVLNRLTVKEAIEALSKRKTAVVKSPLGILSYGTVSLEQAYVSLSSTCFSTSVKFFYDLLVLKESELLRFQQMKETGLKALKALPGPRAVGSLMKGPPGDRLELLGMMEEAGAVLVNTGLVDSFFGNISALFRDSVIFISQTGVCLDELRGAIDEVPLDGTSTTGITASSELPTHRAIYTYTGYRFLLHGHPKITVVLSMYCERECEYRGECYKRCPYRRDLFGVPVVPGEIGSGATSIVRTVPEAFEGSDAVIVTGHGIFTAGIVDYNHPVQRMVEIEKLSRLRYTELLS